MLVNLFIPSGAPENRPIVSITIRQEKYLFLIDTGFTINIISERLKNILTESGQLILSSTSPSTRLYGGSEVKTLDLYMWKSESFDTAMKTAISDGFIPRLKKENAPQTLDGIFGMEFINQFDNISLIFPNFIADLNTKKYPSDYRLIPYLQSVGVDQHLVIKSNYDNDLRAFIIEDLQVIIDRRFNTSIRGIFDTGAEVTVLSYALYKKLGKPAFSQTNSSNNSSSSINIGGSKVNGKYVNFKAPLLSKEREFQVFIVSSNDVNKNATLAMDDVEALIGMDIFMNLPKHETIKMKITNYEKEEPDSSNNNNNKNNNNNNNSTKKRKLLEIFHKKN